MSQDELSMTFRMRLRPTLDFVQELLSYGSALKILAPDSLIDKMRGIVRDMYRQYE